MKKNLSLLLASVLILGLCGCSQQEPPTEPELSGTVSSGIVESTVPPEDTIPQTDPVDCIEATEPSKVTNPMEATNPSMVTEPTETPEATEETKATEPEKPKENTGKQQDETKPTDPPATETTQPATDPTDPPSTKPTEPPETHPPETQTPATKPPETEPAETEPPATQPPETEPSTEATELEVREITWEFKQQVAQYAIAYLNQYRAEAGVAQCTYLPGMTQVAQYRASQLTWNFSHSTADKREALAYYQYGRYIDATLAGLDESASYYEADSAEAICAGFKGVDAEAMGAYIARQIRNSSSHWSYIGSSAYSYIGVGVEYREGSQYGWYTCVMVGSVNYG